MAQSCPCSSTQPARCVVRRWLGGAAAEQPAQQPHAQTAPTPRAVPGLRSAPALIPRALPILGCFAPKSGLFLRVRARVRDAAALRSSCPSHCAIAASSQAQDHRVPQGERGGRETGAHSPSDFLNALCVDVVYRTCAGW